MQVTKSEAFVIRCVASGKGLTAGGRDGTARGWLSVVATGEVGDTREGRGEAILDNPLQLKTNMFIRRENPCV